MKKRDLKLLLDLLTDPQDDPSPGEALFIKGENVFIRTVTHYWIGRVRNATSSYVVLDEASWVAQTARFQQTIQNGELEEVEIVGDGVRVMMGAIVDICIWAHDLPDKQKP